MNEISRRRSMLTVAEKSSEPLNDEDPESLPTGMPSKGPREGGSPSLEDHGTHANISVSWPVRGS